ncbi:transaldolase [Xylogone sp. PMI_703]|nr:transaldolase [Xylogone sp. PMI_703]
MATRTLLERLEQLCNVDVDDVNLDLIKSLPFTPHNQTSNQAVITAALEDAENQGLLEDMIQKYGKDGWEQVYDMTAVNICARNLPYLSGRVLLQVSCRHANDRDAIIKHCHSYAKAFEEVGIPRDRFCIKVPFSGAGASASLQLNEEGIRTLATTVFSLEQAIAASQANCLFISPYYNEIAAHLDPALRPNVKDVALEHPMSARLVHILETFAKAYAETGKEQPIMVIASHFNTSEIFAMAEIGCHHVTIQPHNLKTLMETPDSLPPISSEKPTHPYKQLATPERLKVLSTLDPLSGPNWDGVLATMKTDYVANSGVLLDKFLKEDPVAGKRFNDAIKFFIEAENKAKGIIEKKIKEKGL